MPPDGDVRIRQGSVAGVTKGAWSAAGRQAEMS